MTYQATILFIPVHKGCNNVRVNTSVFVVGAGKKYGIKFTLGIHSYVSRINQDVGNGPLLQVLLWWEVNCQLSFVIDNAAF